MKDKINSYQEAINVLAKHKDKFIFLNSQPEHAKIFLRSTLETSNKYLYIYNKNIDFLEDSKILEKLDIFLKRGGKFELLFDEKPTDKSFFKIMQDYEERFSKNFSAHFINKQNICLESDLIILLRKPSWFFYKPEKIITTISIKYLTLADDRIIRISTLENPDRYISSFNRVEYVDIIKNTFNKLKFASLDI